MSKLALAIYEVRIGTRSSGDLQRTDNYDSHRVLAATAVDAIRRVKHLGRNDYISQVTLIARADEEPTP